eukprot:NODE_301_length_11418_cov_0.342521.p7 type:complete len:198 gc:universal NODE_301_length_11418_cov_0.342521:9892-9299(-)
MRTRSGSFSVEPEEFLFSVTCIKHYIPSSPQELEMQENETFNILEDKVHFYLCYSPISKKKGYIPKNYTVVQKPLCVLAATVKSGYMPLVDEMICDEGDRVIVLASLKEGWVYCKKMSRILTFGKIRIDGLFINDGDLESLPTFQEYQMRTTAPMDLAAKNSEPSTLSKPISGDDEKILEKFKGRARSSSLAKLVKL